jgi:hypothetical protein
VFQVAGGRVYPGLSNIREISVRVAYAVMQQVYTRHCVSVSVACVPTFAVFVCLFVWLQALQEGHFGSIENRARFMMRNRSKEEVFAFVRKVMYTPGKQSLNYSPTKAN